MPNSPVRPRSASEAVPAARRASRRSRPLPAVALVAALSLLSTAALALTSSSSAVAATLPSGVLASKVIGHSVDGRPITAYEMGDPDSSVKAIITGNIHGDEPAGLTVANQIIHGSPIKGIDLWVIPTINPDGTAAKTHGNAHKVDLNRNWPNHFVYIAPGYHYSGKKASSEPETRAMLAFLKWFKPSLMVSMHQPLNGVDTTDGGARNKAFASRLSKGLHLSLKPFKCFSVCTGSMTGWVTTYQKGAAITVEFGTSPSHTELYSVAPAALIHALGGSYTTRAARNPLLHVTPSVAGRTVHLSGYAFDPDLPSSRKSLTLSIDGAMKPTIPTNTTSASLNKQYHLAGAHLFSWSGRVAAGTHKVCVVAVNRLIGTHDASSCMTVKVG